MTDQTTISPIKSEDRYFSLDLLRGVSVLGILIMNIQSFSMIEAAYLNPTAFGNFTGLNKWIWIISHILADQKFMTIFSILFGAGIILMAERSEKKGVSAATLHYKRIFWLLIFGLIHAYILWHGDILVPYAVCGLFVFLFRKFSPKWLFILGLISISVASILYFLTAWSMQFWPAESFKDILATWNPTPEIYSKEIAALQGNWIEQMSHRVKSAFNFQTFVFIFWSCWRAGGLMLIGMALYKWGILIAQKSMKFYSISTILGLTIGIPVIVLGVINNLQANFSLEYSMFIGWQYNYWGSLFVAFAYIAFILSTYQTFQRGPLLRPLTAVGRMAFTNYLLQTMICTIIFYGHGFGFFAEVERIYQILIVFAVWIILIIFSNVWLKHFHFGPAEWLWRSLTYMKKQPFRIN